MRRNRAKNRRRSRWYSTSSSRHYGPRVSRLCCRGCRSKVDYEAELVVVIGRSGRYIPKERALEYVAGYACGNDVSARDWQAHKPGGQWLLGKSFDSFAPWGRNW